MMSLYMYTLLLWLQTVNMELFGDDRPVECRVNAAFNFPVSTYVLTRLYLSLVPLCFPSFIPHLLLLVLVFLSPAPYLFSPPLPLLCFNFSPFPFCDFIILTCDPSSPYDILSPIALMYISSCLSVSLSLSICSVYASVYLPALVFIYVFWISVGNGCVHRRCIKVQLWTL